ncbi:hypothetical protein BUALT_Bualt10G0014600 [Buddleja alternifolia]|uniref:Alcohol dehydrogenase n=1 Tax=Buddleja alternifolia TaxID=168488 RepID=A0AAV6X1T8_9LAMI|nr:hypothetical protein BUALT_Bualt10G0014600 [Buddleja alternifolia]
MEVLRQFILVDPIGGHETLVCAQITLFDCGVSIIQRLEFKIRLSSAKANVRFTCYIFVYLKLPLPHVSMRGKFATLVPQVDLFFFYYILGYWEFGYVFSYIHYDVTKESDMNNVVDFTVSEGGKVDIMFCNVGITQSLLQTSIFDTEKSHFEKVFNVNVFGTFLGAKHAAHVMVPSKAGSIIFTASVGVALEAYDVAEAAADLGSDESKYVNGLN